MCTKLHACYNLIHGTFGLSGNPSLAIITNDDEMVDVGPHPLLYLPQPVPCIMPFPWTCEPSMTGYLAGTLKFASYIPY